MQNKREVKKINTKKKFKKVLRHRVRSNKVKEIMRNYFFFKDLKMI